MCMHVTVLRAKTAGAGAEAHARPSTAHAIVHLVVATVWWPRARDRDSCGGVVRCKKPTTYEGRRRDDHEPSHSAQLGQQDPAMFFEMLSRERVAHGKGFLRGKMIGTVGNGHGCGPVRRCGGAPRG